MTDQLPPNDRLTEEMLLGCILANAPANLPIARGRGIDADSFFSPDNRTIWLEAVEMSEADLAVDVVTMQARLRQKGQLDNAGGYPRLSSLPDRIPAETMCEFYADILMELARDREIIRTCYDMQAESADGVWSDPDRATRYSQRLAELAKHAERTEVKSTKAIIRQIMDEFEQALDHRGILPGLASGFDDLDKITGGFKPGQMVIIAGRPSSGKTAFGVCVAGHIAVTQSKPVGVISLEMTARDITARLLCAHARVSQSTAQDGNVSERDISSLGIAGKRIADSAFKVADSGVHKLSGLMAQAQAWHAEHKLAALVVDYIQLIKSDRQSRSRYEEVSEVSIGLKRLAMELRIPVIVMAQISRAVEKEERRPRMSDLRDSGQIEQDADIIGFLFEQEKQSDQATCKEITLAIAKQRNGPKGDVHLIFWPAETRFESGETTPTKGNE